jgi:hypothetical protein
MGDIKGITAKVERLSYQVEQLLEDLNSELIQAQKSKTLLYALLGSQLCENILRQGIIKTYKSRNKRVPKDLDISLGRLIGRFKSLYNINEGDRLDILFEDLLNKRNGIIHRLFLVQAGWPEDFDSYLEGILKRPEFGSIIREFLLLCSDCVKELKQLD